ncbi:MAG: ketose-bisphosphate aldolase [candidate division Zixibacteria bacterium]|nr:ketose-bisphosphate aldolase [candidate division Zixibacteria bacterium]
MPLADAKEILASARAGGYAVAAFNVNNLESVQAVVAAAEEEHAATFVAVTETALAYGGDALARLALDIIAAASAPLALHLDHGSSVEAARRAVALGFNSVMVDGSTLAYDENVALVAAAVKEFAPRGIAVEGELGHVARGRDRGIFTDPGEAAAFVDATGVGSLAVAVGTSHGAYKFEGEPTIDLPRLEAIAAATPVPLVLHGASAVYEDVVRALEGAGGHLPDARGLSDELLAAAVARGVAKVNVDTDLRLATVAAIRNYLKEDPSAIDPKKILGAARDAVREMARRKIRACRGAAR